MKNYKMTPIVNQFLSMNAGLALMALVAIVAALGTLIFPNSRLFTSPVFLILLGIFCLQLLLCTMRQGYMLSQGIGKLANFIVHATLLIIFAGVMISNLFGFEYGVRIRVGESATIPLNQRGDTQAILSLKDFVIKYYPDGSIYEFISQVELQSGLRGITRTIMVNHPLQFEGMDVYQMSYGYDIQITTKDHKAVWIPEKGLLKLPHLPRYAVRIIEYRPHSKEVAFIIYENGAFKCQGLSQLHQQLVIAPDQPLNLEFTDAKLYSGLGIKYDPGIPIIFFGFILLAVSFSLSIFYRLQRYCAEVDVPKEDSHG